MVTRRRVVLAVNPAASSGRHSSAGKLVEARLSEAGFQVRLVVAEDAAALTTEASRAVADGADALVVVGGDGMVHLGAGIVAGTAVPLGIVPTGTGNDFARGVGLVTGDLDASIRALVAALERPARVVDAATAEVDGQREWFVGVLSAGFDAKVNERANRMRYPRGASRYVLALLRELAGLRPIRYVVAMDGGPERSIDGLLMAVANNSTLGGGMRIAPDADLGDGLLDTVVVAPMGRIRFLRLFPRVFRGAHVRLAQVAVARAAVVTIDAVDQVAYADGERLGRLPVRVEIVPGALHLLTPARRG